MTNNAYGIQREIKMKGRKLGNVTTSLKPLEQLSQTMTHKRRFSQELNKPLQLLQR